MMIKQREYDDYLEKTSPASLDICCGSNILVEEREIFLKIVKPKKVLDIGCGSGNRLLDFYAANDIKFLGIEKSANFRSGARAPGQILNLDISHKSFVSNLKSELSAREMKDYDAIVLLGHVVNGFISLKTRIMAFTNLKELMNNQTYLIINSFCLESQKAGDGKGRLVKMSAITPYQYCYTTKELNHIFKKSNYVIQNFFTYKMPLMSIDNVHYVIKKCN
jgi:cyclopropane fatty-acyl-phospholipid synthase-like methyltransferase